MGKLFDTIDNFTIQKSIVRVTILKSYEKAKYEIDFDIVKNNMDGPNHWDLNSNIEGFDFIGAFDSNGIEISDKYLEKTNLNGGLVRVRLLLDNFLDSNNEANFTFKYINKIESEVLNNKFLRKSYGIILTRSFGSPCLQYSLSVKVEGFFFTLKK